MVRKRGPFDRIEKVVSRKRSSNLTDEKCEESPTKQHKNGLNDQILSLYKKEASLHVASSVSKSTSSLEKNEQSTNAVLVTDKQAEGTTVPSTSSRKSVKIVVEKNKISGFSLKRPSIRFKDVAGLDEVLYKLVQKCYRIRDPKTFSLFNQEKGDYIILYGPSGCGKTHLVNALAGETGYPLLEVSGTELVCGISGESESKIRDIFEEAKKNSPCILFIDRIDTIAPKIDPRDSKGMERRMVTQLLKSLDDFKEKGHSSNVVVIVATDKVDAIDLNLLNRFDCQFNVKIPDEKDRLMILKVLTNHLSLPPDFNLEWVAHHTPGYVGSDLRSLVKEAFNISIERLYRKYIDQNFGVEKCDPNSSNADQSNLTPNLDGVMAFYKSDFQIPTEEILNSTFSFESFQKALKNIIPSSKREGFSTVPSVTWEDIGALEDIKEKINQNIIWPVKYRELYDNSAIETSKGILLYGPKGCGKTLLAKVIANECSINFLSVKGPELLNMYLGESEKAVRQCFQRARDSAPCVIFFDEIDALIPKRSGSINAAADRVVNQLLTLMDGTEERNDVFIIGATNRLEILDSAVLRPGRLDKQFYVGLPTPAGRADILKSLTKNKTKPKISEEVDLEVISHDPRCSNFSGADLAHLVRTASTHAVKEYLINNSETVSVKNDVVEVKLKDFEFAFSEVKASVTEKDLRHCKKLSE